MRITAVSGSPRVEGVTNSILLDILEKGAEKGHFGKVVVLNRLELHGCQACGYCRKEGDKCAVEDKISALIEELPDSDIVLIGSPVYMGNVSAQLKMFIDRLYCLKDAGRKPRLKPKRALLVFSQGAPDKAYYKDMMNQVKKTLDGYNLIVEDIIVATGPDYKNDPEVKKKMEHFCSTF